MNTSILRVHLLGNLELDFCEQKLPLPSTRKGQVLLAYLILHREQPQPRDRLAELFWGDRPEEKARRSLSTAVWSIHHCLPEKNCLYSNPDTLQFDPQTHLWLDVAEFEALLSMGDFSNLQAALGLYRGDFLAGSYEDWILHERYRLENLYLDGLARLMAGYESMHDFDSALEVSQRLLAHDPLREDAHRTAMRVYSWLGQRNAALEQYQRCRAAILQELNAEPMPETSQLYRAIQEGRFGPVQKPPARHQKVHPPGYKHTPGYDPLALNVPSPFQGRDAETAILEAAWQQANASRGSLLLIRGEAGVGKTRLVDEFTAQMSWKGVQVLRGCCYEVERVLPYQPIAEALRSALAYNVGLQPVGEHAWSFREVSRLVPELAGRCPDISKQPALPLDQEQTRLFEGTTHFLRHLSKVNGLLIILEDLHWAAESTLELLHYFVRRLTGESILFIGTVRPEELGRRHPLQVFQDNLKREGRIQELWLQRLAPTAVEALVEEMSGRGVASLPLARRLYHETEGNPFFLMEIIKALFQNHSLYLEHEAWQGNFSQISADAFPLPARLSDAIHNRIQHLNERAQEALTLAAVLGREFDFSLLNETWGQGEDQTFEVIDTLLRHRLIEEGSGSSSRDYMFTHHKIQEVIYAAIPRQRRWQLHAQVGAHIERACAQRLDEYARELAFHYLQALQFNPGYRSKAVTYLLKAGDQARIMYAHQEAIEHYRQALQLLKTQGDYEQIARVNMKLGETYHTAFQFDQAHQAFQAGFHLWQQLNWRVPASAQPAPHPLRMNWPPIISIDPALAMDIPGGVVWQLFSGLVTFSPDLEVIPEAAKRWELLSDGQKYIFHLNEDIYWSDGTQVTAYDFEFGGKRLLSPTTRSPAANLFYDIKGAEAYNKGQILDPDGVALKALDNATLMVELEKPAPYFLHVMVSLLPAPRRTIEAFGGEWTSPEHIVTNGPFQLQAWDKGKFMRFVKNPGYHGRFTGNIDQIELDFQNDPAIQLARYAADQADILDIRSYSATLFNRAKEQFSEEYLSFPWALVHYLGFDLRRPPFNNCCARLAFALAIDKALLAGSIQGGVVYPASGGFVPPVLPGHSPGIGLPYDPAKAQALLAEAGYPGGRGFPQIEGITTLSPDNPVTRYLTEQWRYILGVEIEWKTVSTNLVWMFQNMPPQLYISHWLADYPDPDNFLGPNHILRWTGWSNEAFTNLLEQTRLTTNPADRIKLFEKADQLLMDAVPLLPLTYDRQHLLIKPWVKRYPTSAIYSWFWKDVVIEHH